MVGVSCRHTGQQLLAEKTEENLSTSLCSEALSMSQVQCTINLQVWILSAFVCYLFVLASSCDISDLPTKLLYLNSPVLHYHYWGEWGGGGGGEGRGGGEGGREEGRDEKRESHYPFKTCLGYLLVAERWVFKWFRALHFVAVTK